MKTIKIKDEYISTENTSRIISISRGDIVDKDTKTTKKGISIMMDMGEIPLPVNYTFNSEEERDAEWELIIKQLTHIG